MSDTDDDFVISLPLTHHDEGHEVLKYTSQQLYNVIANRYGISVTMSKKIMTDISKRLRPASPKMLIDYAKLVFIRQSSTDCDINSPSKKRSVIVSKTEVTKIANTIEYDLRHMSENKPDISEPDSTDTVAPPSPHSSISSFQMRECCVCFDDTRINTESVGDGLVCPKCNVCYCYRCLIDQIKATRNFLVCSTKGCSIPIDEFVMDRYFSKTRITSFRPYIKECLLDIEMSLMDFTRSRIHSEGYSRIGKSSVDVSGREVVLGKKKVKMQISSVKMCGVNGCPGFLDAMWSCALCHHKRCKICHIQISSPNSSDAKPKKHKCDPGDVASVKAIHTESCACPKCGEYTSRIDGCNHMFCVMCKTSFYYVQGGVGKYLEDSKNTNPEYHRYQRSLKSGNDVTVDNVGVCQEECPLVNAIPHQDTIINVMSMALCSEHDIRKMCHLHRMAGPGSEADEYIDACNRSEDSKGCETYRELLILARLGTKLNLDGHMFNPLSTNATITLHGYLKSIGGIVLSTLNPDGSYNPEKVIELMKKRALVLHREKQRNYHHRNLLQTFKVACGDILRNIATHAEILNDYYSMRSPIISSTPRQLGPKKPLPKKPTSSSSSLESVISSADLMKAIDTIRDDILIQVRSFETLKKYINDSFSEISLTLGYTTSCVPGITNVPSFVKNIAMPKSVDRHNVDDKYIKQKSMEYACRVFDFVDIYERAIACGNIDLPEKSIRNFGDPKTLENSTATARSVNLARNALKTVSFTCGVKSFAFISTLDLSHNPISRIDERMFEGLASVTWLKLEGCNILTIDDNAFSRTTYLGTLILTNNHIRNVEEFRFLPPSQPKTSARPTRIKCLHISKNAFERLDLNLLPDYIETFDATECGITKVIPNDCKRNGVRMKKMTLAKNPIMRIDETFLRGMSQIQKLNMEKCNISVVHPKAFIGYKSLVRIDLKENWLTHILLSGDTYEGTQPPLTKKIYVRGNRMKDANKLYMDLSLVGIPGYIITGNLYD
jgi:hypothetical protein